eukprot:gene41-633_t
MSATTSNVRCEGNKIKLECERGHVIKTNLALYGELEPGKELCKDASHILELCHKDVLGIVKKDCDGRNLCPFTIGDRFKDLCIAKYFYLDIRYSCEYRPSTHKPTTTITRATTRQKMTFVETTKKPHSAARPITIYKETTEGTTTDTTTNKIKTPGSSSTTSDTKSKSSSIGNSSKSSSSATTTHVPMNAPKTTSSTTKNASDEKKDSKNENKPVTNSGARNNDKTSMYWLLTAYSLVTDKSFIKANFTHMVLAIILSIFIALVLSICFILDHCRRRRRYEALKETNEEEETEPAASIDLEMRRGIIRPTSKPQGSILVTNGASSHINSRSLEEINHNSSNNNERLSLVPLAASLGSICRNGLEETSFIMRSSTSERLPPPPDELLADSPRQENFSLMDNESCSSTISIPPPIGFGDSEPEEKDSYPGDNKPGLIITSPTPTNSSVSSSLKEVVMITPSSSVHVSKRLNNETYQEIGKYKADGNLLLNSVSVQTNDLTQGNDRTSKLDNPGHVSMRSPQFEVPDKYAVGDSESEIAILDTELDKQHVRQNPECSDSAQSSERGGTMKAKKGKLLVIKSESSDTRSHKPMLLENGPKTAQATASNCSESSKTKSNSGKVSYGLSESSSTGSPEEDKVTKKQIFTVPPHRCGMGHKHPCFCKPQRTGSNIFICSCLEQAKYKNTTCCVDKCPEQNAASREPYSSQRPPRERHSDTLKRKGRKDKKLSSSLTDLSGTSRSEKMNDSQNCIGKNSSTANRQRHTQKSSTLSRIPTKTDQVSQRKTLTMSLDRTVLQQQRSSRNGILSNKPITVAAVHPSSKSKDRHENRFGEKSISKVVKKNMQHVSHSEESSDSSEKSDSSNDTVQSKSLPTSPTGTSRVKNGKVRLSPISEDSQKSKSGYPLKCKRAPKFKIQVVQSLERHKRQPVNEV